MERYKKPELTPEDLANVAKLEASFERHGKEVNPQWRQISLARPDEASRDVWDEFVSRVSGAGFVVTRRGPDAIDVKKP